MFVEKPNPMIPQFPEYIQVQGFSTLGKCLKAMRQSRGETQASLARRLHTCRQHVQKWEYDITRPSPKRLKEILDYLKYKRNIDIIAKFYI